MEQISNRDREILRSLAKTKLEYVNSLRNEEILKQWNALGEGRRESPTVRLLFSNFSISWQEMKKNTQFYYAITSSPWERRPGW